MTKDTAKFFKPHGSAIMAALALLLVLGAITAGMQSRLWKKNSDLRKARNAFTYDLAVDSSVSRTIALTSDYSNSCGQTYGTCPGVFPDPLDCNRAQLKQITSSADWGFDSNGPFSNHFRITTPTIPANRKMDLRNVTRIPGSLGQIWFQVKEYGKIDPILSGRLMNEPLQSFDPGRNGKRVIAAVDGFECNSSGYVSAMYIHTSTESPESTTYHDLNVRIPITIPPPSCEISLNDYRVNEGGTVHAYLITYGAWQNATSPANTPEVNPDSNLSIFNSDLIWEGDLTVHRLQPCNTYGRVDASVSGPGGSNSCSAWIDVPIDPAYWAAHCAPTPSPTPTNTALPLPTPTASPTPSATPTPAPEPHCPDPYFVRIQGRQYRMVYVLRQDECVAVRTEVIE